jgi:hypothetical protein
MVKCNHNSGGYSETQLHLRYPAMYPQTSYLPNYKILDSTDAVSDQIWNHPEMVVERFLPERREGLFCLRTWVFLGDRETNTISYSEDPIVKPYNSIRNEEIAEVPEELRKIRRHLQFQFGKFDYALVDGKVVLYDANRTPTLGPLSGPRHHPPRIHHLAEGLLSFL